MTGLTLSIAIHMTFVAAVPGDDASYAQAHASTTKTGRPMLVLVGANWCPACVQMKSSVVPQLKQRGSLADVVFAQVDIDQERELGRQLTNGGPIPQLLMYRQTRAGWRLRRIIGGQSVTRVESFIAEGVALDKAAKTPETPSKSQEGQSKGMASGSGDGRKAASFRG